MEKRSKSGNPKPACAGTAIPSQALRGRCRDLTAAARPGRAEGDGKVQAGGKPPGALNPQVACSNHAGPIFLATSERKSPNPECGAGKR